MLFFFIYQHLQLNESVFILVTSVVKIREHIYCRKSFNLFHLFAYINTESNNILKRGAYLIEFYIL